MSALSFLQRGSLALEFGQRSLKVLDQEAGLELVIERLPHGRITTESRDRISTGLAAFVRQYARFSRPRAICAIGATGVSLRRLTLPTSGKNSFVPLLALQIEKEFPLPPDELAWGWQPLGSTRPQPSGSNGSVEVVVVAVRRDLVLEYAQLLVDCGLDPVFTLAPWVANRLVANSSGTHSILDIGHGHSEWIAFEHGFPTALRTIPWGGQRITRAIATMLGVDSAAAEALKLRSTAEADPADRLELTGRIRPALDQALEPLVRALDTLGCGSPIHLAGRTAQLEELPGRLSAALGGTACLRIPVPTGEGRSAATLALRSEAAQPEARPTLVLFDVAGHRPARESTGSRGWWPWAALALLLAVAGVSLRYLEPWIKRPGLERRLAEVRAVQAEQPGLDRELGFLRFLETNQPPYIGVIETLATAAPRGLTVQSLAMTRRGDLTLRATLQDPQQATGFRSNLLASGWFSHLVVEEQAPVPNQQRQVSLRITARWQPSAESARQSASTTESRRAAAPAAGSASTP